MNFIKGFTSLQPCTFDYTLLALSYYMYRVYHYSFELYTNNLLFILTKVESYTNQITSRITYSILGLSLGWVRGSTGGTRHRPVYPKRYHTRPVCPRVQKVSFYTRTRCTCGSRPVYPDPLYPRVQTRLPRLIVPAGPDPFTGTRNKKTKTRYKNKNSNKNILQLK